MKNESDPIKSTSNSLDQKRNPSDAIIENENGAKITYMKEKIR